MGLSPAALDAEIAAPVRLDAEGSLLRSSMKIRRTRGRIVLLQKTRLWFRAAVSAWAVVVFLTPFMMYSEFFSSTTTRLTCDRTTDACAVNGRATDVPRLSDITRAEMDRDFNRRDGVNWGVNLVTRDGKKHAIDDQRAIDSRAVADYRAAVKTISAYVADPARRNLDVSFTYRASLGEKLQSVFYLVFGVGTLFLLIALWTKTSYVFEPDRLALVTRSFVQRTTQQIPAARISAIADRPAGDGRLLEVQLEGEQRFSIVHAGPGRASAIQELAAELATFLGKPVRSASA